jgi:hypothetical protein
MPPTTEDVHGEDGRLMGFSLQNNTVRIAYAARSSVVAMRSPALPPP